MAIPYKKVNFDNINFDINIKKNKKIVNLQYNNKNFYIQTPELLFKKSIDVNNNILEINIPLFELSNNDDGFKNFLKSLDSFIISKATENSNEWFDVNANEIKYKSIIRNSNLSDKIYKNGVFKLKMKDYLINKEYSLTKNNQSERINISDIPEHCKLKIVFQVCCLWIKNDGFGIFTKPVLLDFREFSETVTFVDDEEDSDDLIDTEIGVFQTNIGIKPVDDIPKMEEINEDLNASKTSSNEHLEDFQIEE